MSDKKYKVIVSDRAKRMLGTHIRFMTQVNKDAAKAKKKELMEAMRSLEHMPVKVLPAYIASTLTLGNIMQFYLYPVKVIQQVPHPLYFFHVLSHYHQTILSINHIFRYHLSWPFELLV